MPDISAYHEAGHAFMAIYVAARVRSVTIQPDWDDGPERHTDIQVEWPLDQFTTRELNEKSVLVAFAGPVAEMIHSGEPYLHHSHARRATLTPRFGHSALEMYQSPFSS